MPDIQFSPDYTVWFSDLKQRISLARQKASLTLNATLMGLYWEIGCDIVEKEEKAAWGSGLIERLSRDLTHALPDMKEFSCRNLYAINRDDADYILETFPIVKRKDIAQFGEYRTKNMILEIYDAMQRAKETGQPYQTILDPPPADPRVAHSFMQDG